MPLKLYLNLVNIDRFHPKNLQFSQIPTHTFQQTISYLISFHGATYEKEKKVSFIRIITKNLANMRRREAA